MEPDNFKAAHVELWVTSESEGEAGSSRSYLIGSTRNIKGDLILHPTL